MAKSLVVFSGGMDSVYALFEARKHGEAEALFFDYGQRHLRAEYNASAYICSHLEVPLHRVSLVGLLKSKSVLTDPSIVLDQYKNYSEAEQKLKGKVEPAFVPMRNSMFMVVAANRAVVDGFTRIYLGIAKEDGDTVPDCTLQFLVTMKDAIHISLDDPMPPFFVTPLLKFGKVRGIQNALKNLPGCYAAWAFSHTSYAGDYPPISRDHASVCREDAFNKAKVPDPLIMRAYLSAAITYPSEEVYLMWENRMKAWAHKWYKDKTYKAFEDLESIVKLGV